MSNNSFSRKQVCLGVQLREVWGEDKLKCYKFIFDLAKHLDMKVMGSPLIEYIDTPGNKGISAVCIIQTSHICVHEWPEYNELQLDIFSCKDFDTSELVKWISSNISAEQVLLKVVQDSK